MIQLGDGKFPRFYLMPGMGNKCLHRFRMDEDNGLHKKVCEGVEFFKAEVISVQEYFSEFEKASGGKDLINKFQQLKQLKGFIA